MTEPTRQISPDGAYWWDGQAWRPMPSPSAAAPLQQSEPDAARPSWLPEGTSLPDQMSASITSAATETVNAPIADAYSEPVPSPQWMAPRPLGASRSPIILVAAAALVLIVAGGAVYAFQSLNRQSNDTSGGTPTATSAPPSSNPSPNSPPAVVLPLTAQLGGEYCPVAHPNDAACWKGSLLNTGPVIRKLALVFVVGGGYDDWFAHHANGTLSGFYTTAGCDVDPANHQMVCGSVAAGGRVDVYLGGDVTTRGTFHYAVKFADISLGSPVYVNQHPDGTHDIVSWTEVIT